MPAQQQHFITTAYLSGSTGEVAAGTVICLSTAAAERYVVSSAANRTLYSKRSAGLAITAGDDDNPAVEMQTVGVVPARITGLGEGTASLIRVSSDGELERTATYNAADDVCGHCDEDGNAYVCFALVGIDLSSGGSSPGGSIFGDDLAHFWGGQYSDSTGTWIDEAGDEDVDDAAFTIPPEDTINRHTYPTFDGVGGALTTTAAVTTLDGLDSFCIFGCFNAGENAFGSVVEQALQFGIQFSLEKIVAFVNDGSGGDYILGTSTIDDGRWHRFILSVDAGAASLYVDGVLEGTSTFTAIEASGLNALRFGVSGSGVHFQGGITAVGIATRAATVEEVLLLDAGLANWVGGGDATSFRGVPLANDTPMVGGSWVYTEDGTYAFQKPVHPGMYSVKDYGAVGDGVTDDWQAITDTFTAAAADADGKGAIVHFPEGVYRVSATIDIDSAFRIKGCGSAIFYARSAILADSGVTAFRLWPTGVSGPVGFGGANTSIEDLAVFAAAKNTNTVTATYTSADTTVPVSAAGDFVDGQLVAIEGVGMQVPLVETTATTTSGSPTVVLSTTGDSTPVIRIGHYLIIGTAFTTPTRVTNVVGLTLTMASNAATSLTPGTHPLGEANMVTWCAPLFAMIVSGGGTTTWTIDAYHGETSMSATVSHADAAFDILCPASISRVLVGDAVANDFFIGPSFLVRGDHSNVPSSNANSVVISDCRSYGSRHAVYTIGADSNACRFQVQSLQCTDWSFVDCSHLGNLYSTCHADSGSGFLQCALAANASVYVGCYTEGGTFNSFNTGALILGGTMGNFNGGTAHTKNLVNGLHVGSLTYRGFSVDVLPGAAGIYEAFLLFNAADATYGGLAFGKKTVSSDPGVTGYYQWSHALKHRNHPMLIADTNQSDFVTGTMWFPHDTWHGESSLLKDLDATYGARRATLRSGIGGVIQDPAQGPYDEDYLAIGSDGPKWLVGDWIQDPLMLDGCPTRHVTEEGHRAENWQAGTSYAQYQIVCPTINNHNGRIYAKLHSGSHTSDATEPTWTSAPNLNDTIVDNGVTWTNIGEAAYTQPVELDGYIEYTMVADADESWTQSARQFLCGSVKITKTLGAGRTITLPAGRYKRWLWNNTNQTLTFTTGTGNTVAVATGKAAEIQCTGTEFRRRTADVTP